MSALPANDDVPLVHSRGLGYGPATLCGAEGPVPEPAGEVTCDGCLDIIGDCDLLAARVAEVQRTHGPPPRWIHLGDEWVIDPATLPIEHVRLLVEMLEMDRRMAKDPRDAADDARSHVHWIEEAIRACRGPRRDLRANFLRLANVAFRAVLALDRKQTGGPS